MKLFISFLLIFAILYAVVKAESLGDGASFFGDAEHLDIDEICADGKCKTAKSVSTREPQKDEPKQEGVEDSKETSEGKTPADKQEEKNIEPEEINVMITFTNAVGKSQFHKKFELTVTSLLAHARVPIALYILGDPESQDIAKKIIEKKAKPKSAYRVSKHLHLSKS